MPPPVASLNRLGRNLATRLQGFAGAERGAISAEAMIVLPVLFWGLIATFVYFDAFRANTTSNKAAYTVADAISRQTGTIDEPYLDGMNTLYERLSLTRHPTELRVTSISWNEDDQEFKSIWSYSTGQRPQVTTAMLNQRFAERLPDIPEGDNLLMIEAIQDYRPPIRIGLGPRTFQNIVVTRPRYAPQVRFFDGETLLFDPMAGASCDDPPPLCDFGVADDSLDG